jgi:hypothetical protein
MDARQRRMSLRLKRELPQSQTACKDKTGKRLKRFLRMKIDKVSESQSNAHIWVREKFCDCGGKRIDQVKTLATHPFFPSPRERDLRQEGKQVAE